MPKYTEIPVGSTYETPRLPRSSEHGERYDATGAIIAHLPGDTKPCPGDKTARGGHDEDCLCGGIGFLPIRRPDVEHVDAKDDGMESLAEALAGRDAEGKPIDPYLGAPIGALMKRDVAHRTSSGSGRKGKQVDPRRIAAFDPHPSIEDGRVERRGRPPRFGEVRAAKMQTAIEPETANLLEAQNDDLANLAQMILAQPECAAILSDIKATKTTQKPRVSRSRITPGG